MTDKEKESDLRKAAHMSERIYAARYTQGLTLQQLAQKIGASNAGVISRWEQRKRSPESCFVPLLAAALNIDVWILVAGEEKEIALQKAANIAERIYLSRYTQGFTSYQLAQKIGSGKNALINHWEQGISEPTPHFIPLLADTLNIDAWVLVTGKEKEKALEESAHMAERIYLGRYTQGLTLQQLAQKIGASSNALICRWERRKVNPEPHFIPLLAAALNIDVWILVAGKRKAEALEEETIRQNLVSRHIKITPLRIVGERIRLARCIRGLNRQELADSIGVAKSSVANWENGTASAWQKNISRLYQMLKIEPELLKK